MNFRLHPSSLEDWHGCAKRFEYANTLRVKPEWRHPAGCNGTAVHAAVAALHRGGTWDLDRTTLLTLYSGAFADAVDRPVYEMEVGVPIWWGDLRDERTAMAHYAADAVEMLEGYMRDKRNSDALVRLCEARWRATFGGFDWEGTLDQARLIPDREGGGIELVDLKTSAEALDPVPLSMWPQGLTYALGARHGVFQPLGAPPEAPWTPMALEVRRLTWVQLRHYVPYLKGGKRKDGTTYAKGERRGPAFHSVEVTPAMFESHAREIALMAADVRDGRYPRRPSNQQCTYRCKFTERCTKDFMGLSIDRKDVAAVAGSIGRADYDEA